MIKAVQQFMLGTAMKNEKTTKNVLAAMKQSGYDGIELCTFMTKPSGFVVKLITQAAGMPVGNCGKYDWAEITREAGLIVPALHTYIQSLENEKDYPLTVAEAKKYGTDTIVITGMYQFDYSNEKAVTDLAHRLNAAGKKLADDGLRLLYHNHNCELQKVPSGKCAYDIIIEETDPEYVNFEFDSYWWTEGGASALNRMKKLGNRMRMWHINDRGHRPNGKPAITPIVKSDSMELGTGTMDLAELAQQAKINHCEAVILESHRNWIDNSPVKSLELSSKFINENF